MLIRHFYVSEIVEGVTDLDLQVILGTAQVNNRRLDLTGMLAQSDGHFAQVLEGRAEAVLSVLARIRRDPRHRDVRTLLQEPIEKRQFARWAMGLLRRDDMTDEMNRLHREGCADEADARRLISQLLMLRR
jgi:hypothetical protein